MAYYKYYLQKRQVSYDNGLTWEDVTPSETRQGAFIDSYETLSDCEGVIDYSKQYLTFVAEADNLSITLKYANSNVLQYSVDSGTTWNNLSNNGSTTTVNSGETIMLKATGLTVNDTYGIGTIEPSVSAKIEGNIMSLLYGDDFENKTELSKTYQFSALFYNCRNLTSAENFILPATSLSSGCYRQLFYGCSSLVTAPDLIATSLPIECYYCMFYNCSNLNYIKCLATSGISTASQNLNWVQGVASTGTFVKDANATWTTGVSGIPNGWTVIDNS